MADKEYKYFSFIPAMWSPYNIKSDKLLSGCEQTNEKCLFVKQDSHVFYVLGQTSHKYSLYVCSILNLIYCLTHVFLFSSSWMQNQAEKLCI